MKKASNSCNDGGDNFWNRDFAFGCSRKETFRS
jgi:hypothetical protein